MPTTTKVNCKANTPIKHQYAMTAYAGAKTDPYTMRFTAENFGLRQTTRTVEDQGTGTPWTVKGSEITANYQVGGPITLAPRPTQLDTILPCLFGFPGASGVFKPGGDICEFFQIGHLDPVAGRIFKYQDLATSTWRMSASDSAQILRLEWNVEGASRDKDTAQSPPGTFTNWPTLPLSTEQPFVFRQCVVTVGGTAYRVKDIEIGGNNNLALDDFFNSAYRVEMPTQRQDFTFSHTSPFDGATFAALTDGEQLGVAATVVFTSGTNVLTISFPNLFATPEDPGIQGRNRVMNRINWKAQYDPAVSGEVPISITNAH